VVIGRVELRERRANPESDGMVGEDRAPAVERPRRWRVRRRARLVTAVVRKTSRFALAIRLRRKMKSGEVLAEYFRIRWPGCKAGSRNRCGAGRGSLLEGTSSHRRKCMRDARPPAKDAELLKPTVWAGFFEVTWALEVMVEPMLKSGKTLPEDPGTGWRWRCSPAGREIVSDVCAAPGGKKPAHCRHDETGKLVRDGCAGIGSTAERKFACGGVEVASFKRIASPSGRLREIRGWPENLFGRVIDVPCSNTA